jgi:hypothetical protein
MQPPLIWADFNASGITKPADEMTVVYLTKIGTIRDLKKQGLELTEGMPLRLYDNDLDKEGNEDNLVADGVAHFDEQAQRWTARVHVAGIIHVSEAAQDPDHWASEIDWAAIRADQTDSKQS